ncbi:cysteine hydrolase family protein [Pseudoclavibacter sp. CFCC 11306]|uniref:cysteine hydrolase family protein n=1 Tax=Pseudoclavibacter sp. CFCC 11306 TaxID=1564493 RepID=UPI001300D0AA|nr:isochorismatase family cysteine hydrolase [Pseudoclavibacter sp. CFCC 11306]KAB1658867.1 cysteine hydrolase [Pseudoclavibacter sp. CFCC 11306]
MDTTELDFRYHPDHAAIVVIDMQADYCASDGALARMGFDTSAGRTMAHRLSSLLESARQIGLTVVFVRTTHGPSDDSHAWLNRYGCTRGDEPVGKICREEDPVGCAWFGVEPQEHELVITKHRYSAFSGTPLAMKLRTMGIDSLLFTGVATEICVESSLRDALFEDFYVTLIEDCAASFTAVGHQASVDVVRANFGTVTDAATLRALWQSAKAHGSATDD